MKVKINTNQGNLFPAEMFNLFYVGHMGSIMKIQNKFLYRDLIIGIVSDKYTQYRVNL